MDRPVSFAERIAKAFSAAMNKDHAREGDPEDNPMAGVVAVIDDDRMMDPLPTLTPIKRPVRRRS